MICTFIFFVGQADRLGKNGIIAFVSNSSFIDAITFDGFRKVIAKEFSEIWIIDTKGNARNSGEKRRQEGGNVFSDQIRVGVAVYFLVRNTESTGFKVYYNAIKDYATAEEKKAYFISNTLKTLNFNRIAPDKKHNWLNLTDNDYDEMLPLIDKEVKRGKSKEAVFKLFSSGVKTQRDEWVYDFSQTNLEAKMKFVVKVYQETFKDANYPDKMKIKWDRELTNYLKRKIAKKFDSKSIVVSWYRPFIKKFFYFDQHFIGMTYQWFSIYNSQDNQNKFITFKSFGSNRPFNCLATDSIAELHVTGANQCLPLYYYEKGQRTDNITKWGLDEFQNHYQDQTIAKIDIFHYTYAVLHNPAYREKYELNLKREFPRIPFYENFRQWVEWGEELMDLHLNYETIEPYKLTRIDLPQDEEKLAPKPKLKADKTQGKIIIDTVTTLEDIPEVAWEYRLGNRSALEWILDQYKEKKPKDKTIAEQFNNYRFADYKETVIDLLKRVCTVSVETMKIINEGMRN